MTLAGRLQHTNVAPDAVEADIRQLCRDCLELGFDGAMVQPCWVPLARELLAGSAVKVCTAFGYPMGGDGLFAKLAAARDCIARGADEIDFMPNAGLLKSGYAERYRDEVRAVVEAAEGRVVKVMLEMGMLSDAEAERAVQLSIEAGAHYVKNSSGFGQGGQASVGAVQKLVRWAGGRAKVKASGGIRTRAQARSILDAGAALLGTSSGVAIVRDEVGEGDY